MRANGPTGVARMLRATVSSWRGLCATWHSEAAFRQETVVAVVAIPAGLWLGRTSMERALLVGVVLAVLVVELLNTGIEAAVDRIGIEHHDLSGFAKDCGSAAVMLSLVTATVVWLLVLWR